MGDGEDHHKPVRRWPWARLPFWWQCDPLYSTSVMAQNRGNVIVCVLSSSYYVVYFELNLCVFADFAVPMLALRSYTCRRHGWASMSWVGVRVFRTCLEAGSFIIHQLKDVCPCKVMHLNEYLCAVKLSLILRWGLTFHFIRRIYSLYFFKRSFRSLLSYTFFFF